MEITIRTLKEKSSIVFTMDDWNDYFFRYLCRTIKGKEEMEKIEEGVYRINIPESRFKPDDALIKRVNNLAKLIREIFPAGFKTTFSGGIETKYSWRDSNSAISTRLYKFFKRYGEVYTDQQILDATQRYVNANKDNVYMKLLKYFIFKDATKKTASGDGYIETTSDLLAYLENTETGKFEKGDIGELI